MSSNKRSGGTATPTSQEISARLSRQLHDTTQPLTVLQGLLELALIKSRTQEDYKQSVELALRESARVAVCFEELSNLIRLQQRETEHQTLGANHV
jgi:signal transduction histidine kinase